jgi:hypothetical protein
MGMNQVRRLRSELLEHAEGACHGLGSSHVASTRRHRGGHIGDSIGRGVHGIEGSPGERPHRLRDRFGEGPGWSGEYVRDVDEHVVSDLTQGGDLLLDEDA